MHDDRLLVAAQAGGARSMRVIHVIPGVTEEASGPSYSVRRLCESLTDLGEEVTLAAMDLTPMSVRPGFLKLFPLGLGPRRLGRSPTMYRWLSAEVDSGRVDVLHNHGMWQMSALYPGWCVRGKRSTLVVSPRGSLSGWAMNHGSALKRVAWPLLQRRALSAAVCFHATGDAEYADVRGLGFTQPVAIVPNAVDVPELSRTSTRDLRTLLFLGRIHPVKGIELLLYAWAAVMDRFADWRLQVVGDDATYAAPRGYFRKIRMLAETLQLQRIVFSGALYGDAKWSAYRAAELFVLPTHSENFGMAVAESLAAGTPVIVARTAPWQGLESHGSGWWIEPGLDPLVAALEVAMSRSPQALQVLGANGHEWMKRDFSWPAAASRMRLTYRWLAHGGTRPAWVRN